jgi:hypothetical protein
MISRQAPPRRDLSANLTVSPRTGRELAVRYAALMSQLRKSSSVVIRAWGIRDDWNNVGCMTTANLMDASAFHRTNVEFGKHWSLSALA